MERTRPLQNISKSGIFKAYVKLRPSLGFLHVTRRSNYFDSTLESMKMEFSLRMKTGERFKGSRNPWDDLALILGD